MVDADLSDYFNTIPHGPLMRCLSRRIADGQVLSTIRQWLRMPVVERTEDGERRTTEAADKNRGVPQGGPASPMLANLYFRRFILAWKQFGHERQAPSSRGQLCGRPGHLLPARQGSASDGGVSLVDDSTGADGERTQNPIGEAPGRIVSTSSATPIGRFYGRQRPALHRHATFQEGRAQAALADSRGNVQSMELAICRRSEYHEINPILRGWCGYFNQGPVATSLSA